MIDVASWFPGAASGVYLNTASMALGNLPGSQALVSALERWQAGAFDWVQAEGVAEDLRSLVASQLQVSPDDIAFVTGVSGGASTVAAQLPPGVNGANIVVPEHEFASNFVPWMLLQDRGYQIRLVKDTDGVLSADAFATKIDSHTAVIATSLIQSATGFRIDLAALKTQAAEAEAWLVIDASQAFGSIAIDIDGIDALFSCSHKWILGMRGMGHLYVRPELHDSFVPITPGWKAAARPMESFYGPTIELSTTASKLDDSVPWFDPIVNIEGLRIIESVGIESIETHGRVLIDDLESRGFTIPFDAPNRSPIVSIDLEDPEAAMSALTREGIKASIRAGKLRISVHLYNTHEDMAVLAAAIS
ncbi:MAG: aminotransferase class V-fold PLP-dependent enzyme [Acidobacteria bacterium]|nr:aminotransferase class V-fold PLP-dependent enzyme [Acidobacteriota bacterium]